MAPEQIIFAKSMLGESPSCNIQIDELLN